ncbi:MAG TPA: helix-turn-helix domain-containing protein [Terriglobales bacterium]|nr:helix-turn-helix domain-containing protein [Terriglobales bacterium]
MATRGCDPLVAMKPEDCPVQVTVDVIAGKWKPLILFYLKHRTVRFNELRRMIPEATHKMLTQQLRDLERAGIVTRKIYPEIPPRVEYSLSPEGQTLKPILAAMAEWGEKYREQHPQNVKRWKRLGMSSTDRPENNGTTANL